MVWGLSAAVGEGLFALGGAAWLLLAGLYALKWLIAPEQAAAEAEDAVQCCFIGLAGVATLLIAQGSLPYARPVAVALFIAGATFTLGFGLWRTGMLWRGGRAVGSTTPILYLPLVAGGFVTGTTAAALGWRTAGQLAFGAALFSWLAIESVLLHRLYTGEPLPPALRPTLGIQLAPPAVGAVSCLAVSPGVPGMAATALVGYASLQALLLVRMAWWIAEAPFAASYWAFTFGATALAAAATKVSASASDGAISIIAATSFVVANLLVSAVWQAPYVSSCGIAFSPRRW